MEGNAAMTSKPQSLCLYHFPLSGHAHRARLFLSLLGLDADIVDIDLLKGEQKTPDFLGKNPFGQVPVLEDGDVTIADSNAILVYLALRYDPTRRWYPVDDPIAAARVQRWLSVAAGELHAGPAAARVAVLFKRPDPLEPMHAKAKNLFTLLNAHLAGREFLAAQHPTIADVALYTYTSHAPEGGIPLHPYTHVGAWLARMEALPGFVTMKRVDVAKAG
jgi:glutathione S-transferase